MLPDASSCSLRPAVEQGLATSRLRDPEGSRKAKVSHNAFLKSLHKGWEF